MWELLQATWELVAGVGGSVWGLVCVLAGGLGDLLMTLHTTAPRLEGLLIGVALAWLMLRRDQHPLLRVLSAPLKLVVDILDLAWDQAVEVVSDLWDTARGWIVGSVGWVWSKVVVAYRWVMSRLSGLRDLLRSKKDKED